VGSLPNPLQPSPEQFSALWEMHPLDYHEIKMHGRMVKTPRWQQAFGHDYAYTGRVNRALPIPTNLEPLVSWAREVVDTRLNGILVNWYDSALRHYIGRHRDSVSGLVEGSPIVTISLGAERTFRLRPWPSKLGGPRVDLPATDGAVFAMPWATNRAYTHEVPAGRACSGRRISVTLRAFKDAHGEEQDHEQGRRKA
jgi:alkylated DNA repair dioxygenase AlkB